jgi:nicotinate phosphoribosyltransferase
MPSAEYPKAGGRTMTAIPTWEEIRRGDTTDIYFVRTLEVLRKIGRDRVRVKAEAFVKTFPAGYEYGILAGLDEMLALLAGRKVDVRAMEEGALFHTGEPVFAIEGPYGEFCEMETAMLGVLCEASGVATRTSRIKHLAGDRTILSFGARRMHPAVSTIIDRNAFIGGADGISAVRSAAFLGEAPAGTMPHALILVLGDTVAALRAFDEAVDPAVPRVCLIDTLQDEKFEAIRSAEALGKRLAAVRLDTPSSRRGNFRKLCEEVRWELDLRGFSHVRIILSGGIGEEEVAALRDVADGFGVGTSLCNAPTIDYALDIVEVEGVPFAKRGKNSGSKQVYACDACGARAIVPESDAPGPCPCGEAMEPLLLPAMRDGEILAAPASPREIRERVLDQVRRFHSRKKGKGVVVHNP